MAERPNILQENSRPCASPAFATSELPAAGTTSPGLGHLRGRACRSSSCLSTLLAAFASVAAVAVLVSLCSRAFEKRALHGLRIRRLSSSEGHDTSVVLCSDTDDEDDEKEYQSLHLLNFSSSPNLELPLKKKLLARVAANGTIYDESRTQQQEQQEHLQAHADTLDLSTRTGEVGPWPFLVGRPVSSTRDQLLGHLGAPAGLSNLRPHQHAAGHLASYREHSKPLEDRMLRRLMRRRRFQLQREEWRQQQLQLHLQRQHDQNQLDQQQRLFHWQQLLWQQQKQQILQSQGQYFMHHLEQQQHQGEYTAPPCHWHRTQVGQRTEQLGLSLPQSPSPLPSPQLQTTKPDSAWGLMNIRFPQHSSTNFASGARRKSPAKLRKLQQQIWQMQLQMRQMQQQIVWLQRRLQKRLRPGQQQKSHSQQRHLTQQQRQLSRFQLGRHHLLHRQHQQHMTEYQEEQRLLQQQEQQEVKKDHQQPGKQHREQVARRRESEQHDEEQRQLVEPKDLTARYLLEDAWISSGSSVPESLQSSTTQEVLRPNAVDTAADLSMPGFSRMHVVLGVPRDDASTAINAVASGDEAVATTAAGAVTANTPPRPEFLGDSASISGDGLSFNVSIVSRPRDNDSTQAVGAAKAEAAAGSTTPTSVSSVEVTELASVPASSRPAIIEHPFVRLPKAMLDNTAAPLIDLEGAVATRPGRRDVLRLLQAAHDLLAWPILGARYLNDLARVTEELIENAVNHQHQDVSRLKTSRAAERLATRFLLLDAVVSAFLVLGQQADTVHWKTLTDSISHASPPVSKFGIRFGRQTFNSSLCQKLSKAIVTLKTGARPPPVDLLGIKRMLFCSPLSPQRFRTPDFDNWRNDDIPFGGL